MHNIKEIRKDFDEFKKLMKSRNVNINLDDIISLDKNNRNLIQEKENFEMEKKNISKSKDESLFAKSKEISLKIEDLNKKHISVKKNLEDILSSLPNIPLNDVPKGKDENDNIVYKEWGNKPKFSFNPIKQMIFMLLKFI